MSNRFCHDTPNAGDSHYCPAVCGRMQGPAKTCPFCDGNESEAEK